MKSPTVSTCMPEDMPYVSEYFNFAPVWSKLTGKWADTTSGAACSYEVWLHMYVYFKTYTLIVTKYFIN